LLFFMRTTLFIAFSSILSVASETTEAISPEEVIDVITNKVDLNKDGLVSKEELEAMFHEMRKIDALREAKREMSEADTDKDGKLSVDELLQFYGLTGADESQNEDDHLFETSRLLRVLVALADSDQDDKLTVEEYSKIIYPHQEVHLMEAIVDSELKTRDTDGDGKLNIEEYTKSELERFKSDSSDADVDNEQLEALSADFKKIDSDEDGLISKREFANHIINEQGVAEGIKQLMDIVDDDHDNVLSLPEINSHMEDLIAHPFVKDWILTPKMSEDDVFPVSEDEL